MLSWRRALLALGAVVLGASALVGAGARHHAPAALAQSGTAWSVAVGGSVPGNIEMNAFFPANLAIRQGDTVNFEFRGFHTVTFNAGQKPLDLILPGSNGELNIGPAFLPFPPGPMPPAGPYDGSRQISTGTPQDPDAPPFSLTFTRAGVFAYVCAIHPGQAGQITVLPPGSTPAETPAQASARGEAEFAIAAASISGLLGARPPAPAGPRPIANVLNGISTPLGASSLNFHDAEVTVPRGGTVVWTMADPFEVHTVTFLGGTPKPEFVDVTPNPMGPPSLVIRANVANPEGGPTFTGQGYYNSGVMTPGSTYMLTFDAPPGVYEYICVVHEGQAGRVRVVAP